MLFKDEENYFDCVEGIEIDKDEEENKESIEEKYHKNLLSREYAGVLKVDQTFGRKNKRLLYKVCPYDKELPYLLIPYDLKIEFIKEKKNKYVLFKYEDFFVKPYRGYLTRTLGDYKENDSYIDYLMYGNDFKINLKPIKTKIKLKLEIENFEKELEIQENDVLKDEFIFTIDNKGTMYYDDGMSILKKGEDTYISIYVTNVVYYMEKFELWDCLEGDVRNIYAGLKTERIFPEYILNMCSLKERNNKRVHKITFKNNKLESVDNVSVYINKNFVYEEIDLQKNENYREILKKTIEYNVDSEEEIKDSKDLVKYWMIRLRKENETNKKVGFGSPLRRNVDIRSWIGESIMVNQDKERVRRCVECVWSVCVCSE